MKRCSICIIPETAQKIEFDENGVCQICRDFKKEERKGESALKKEVSRYVDAASGKSNCIVPVSGGRDSSYALYYAKRVLMLNPLAVHNDNDFETEIAKKNIDNITKSINVPLIRIQSKDCISKKIVSEKFKMNAPFGPGLVVDQTCEACKYGFESAVYNTSRRENIPLVIWGDSIEESTASFHELFEHKVPTKLDRLSSKGGLSAIKYKYYFTKMKKEYGSDSHEGVKEIHLYDYIEWDRKVIVETIQDKLNWAKPKESVSTWRIDCSLTPLVNYLVKKAYGVSKIELGFSQMVRCGKMDREDAIEQAEMIEKMTNVADIRRLIKDLGVSDATINKVL